MNTYITITPRYLVTPVALTLLLVLAGCDGPQAAPAATAKAVPVQVETLYKAPLTQTLSLTGTVEAGRIAQLASSAEGPICCIKAREGDRVERGQVVLNLGRREGAAALVASLNEDLKKEEDNLARTRSLVTSGALPGEQLDNAAANVIRIRAQLAKAQETTQDHAVVAPWAGVVSKMKVREGDFVAPRAPLAEVYDPDSLLVRLALPEQEAAGVSLGMVASVALDAYPGQTYAGRVVRLYPYLDPRTRTRTAEIVLDRSPLLLPGMFARVELVQATVANALTVPAHALVPQPGGGMAVFVVEQGKAVRRAVETGAETGARVRVLSGLAAGEQLIVAGQERLKDGAAVKAAAAPADLAKPAVRPDDANLGDRT